MIFRHHYRTKGLWNEKVVEDQWYLREFYTMTDVKVNNMAPRMPETPGPTDTIVLDITGEMTTTALPGQGKPSQGLHPSGEAIDLSRAGPAWPRLRSP